MFEIELLRSVDAKVSILFVATFEIEPNFYGSIIMQCQYK